MCTFLTRVMNAVEKGGDPVAFVFSHDDAAQLKTLASQRIDLHISSNHICGVPFTEASIRWSILLTDDHQLGVRVHRV